MPSRPPTPPELVGRRLELAALAAHETSALTAKGRLVFVSGEAGVGKSRLLRAFLAGKEALEGYCFEENPPLPYAPFVDALLALMRRRGLGEEVDASAEPAFDAVASAAFGGPASLRPLFASAFDHADFRHYLAFDGELAVAAASLYIKDGVGSLVNGATLSEYRRRGAQGALIARRIRDAAETGAERVMSFTAESTPERYNPSYHNMLRAGFELLYLRPNFHG